jgi:hypothetical protein
VFQQLATYLAQYKQVTIPQVGSFELILQPATLDVASKLIEPPLYLPRYSDKDLVPEHQLHFLALDLNTGKDQVKDQLENFGKELKVKIQSGVFSWKGIGKLENAGAKLVFYPDVSTIKGFQPVPAKKVLRKNVQHTILRGEQEVVSASFYDEEKKVEKKRSISSLAGWMVVIISVVFIAFYLYQQGLRTSSSGTKMKVVPSSTSPTHK